jgi:RHS repeat-associated protein
VGHSTGAGEPPNDVGTQYLSSQLDRNNPVVVCDPRVTHTDHYQISYDALNRLVWAGDTGTPTGGDHCGSAPSGTTIATYQQSYTYDALDRLTSGPSGTETYGTTPTHGAITLSSVPNRYASYDAMGNMTCRNVDTTAGSTQSCGTAQTGALMSYDNEGHFSSWTAPGASTPSDQFLYDSAGHRVLQRVSNGSGSPTDTITFDDVTDVTINGSQTSTTKYYTVNGQRVAMRQDGVLSYLVPDLLGSVSLTLYGDGSTEAMQLYAPYGATRYSDGTTPTAYGFTGQRFDSTTGLMYYGTRYYDPVSGRFTSADSLLMIM